MKLTTTQIERTLDQYEAKALPDSHPLVSRLSEIFGDHTFFLDGNGLSVVEPSTVPVREGVETARVINLANWTDERHTSLAPHEPEATDAIVELGSIH